MLHTTVSATDASADLDLAICIPIYNDWESARLLLQQFDAVMASRNMPTLVVLVDDGSTESIPDTSSYQFQSPITVEVLRLRRNLGHQRAIVLGIAYIHATYPTKSIVVMDGDGEDAPSDVLTLIEHCKSTGFTKVVFASRRKRSESLLFRVGYAAYRFVHRLLTGRNVRIGNFSIIPAQLVPRVVGVSEVWNHYAAGMLHARLPIATVPIDRAKRLAGKPKMNFVSLVAHGMSAISVFGDVVGVRLLCVVTLLTAGVFGAILTVLAIRLFTDFAIPGWATNAMGLLFAVLLNLLTLSVVFVMVVLQARNTAGFLPLRDWEYYVDSNRQIR